MPAIAAMPDGIYYRVKHPEFSNGLAYKALFFTTWAESGWDQITFINERGMTYSVKNFRCFCLNGQIVSISKHLEAVKSRHPCDYKSVCDSSYMRPMPREFKPSSVDRSRGDKMEMTFLLIGWKSYPLWLEPDQEFLDLPWPKPVGKNPDTESDG